LVKATDGQKEYSKLVAQNLFNFMMSFHADGIVNNQNGIEYLVVPTNVFTKWMNKFDEKYAKDPNFILKTTLG
jgi:protein Hikeshi